MSVQTTAERLPQGMALDRATRLGDLFDAHHDRLYRLARRLTPTEDDALDLVQETFLKAARGAGVPADTANAEAWLVRVLVNTRRDDWRKAVARRRHDSEVRLAGSPQSDPEARAIASTTVWRALDALHPRRRAIIVLHELEGASVAAIAALLGITSVTVRWHLARGRRELAHALTTSKGLT
jgi:RNA polymerase sigma-70 factor (ECF subfamily)